MNDRWIVVSGNPVDGFTFNGPFDEHEEACRHGESIDFAEWWAARLYGPSSPTPADHALAALVRDLRALGFGKGDPISVANLVECIDGHWDALLEALPENFPTGEES